MPRCLLYPFCCLAVLLLVAVAATADPTEPDWSDYRTVDTAVTTRVSFAPASRPAPQPGYLGIQVEAAAGDLIVAQVDADSPAARAGLRADDVLHEVNGRKPAGPDALRELLQTRAAGDTVKLVVLRKGKPLDVEVQLDAPSRPLTATAGSARPVLGVRIGEATRDGLRLEQVTPEMPAAKAGLKGGDVIAKVDGKEVVGPEGLANVLSGKKPGDFVTVTFRRDGKAQEVKVELASDPTFEGRGRNWDSRGLRAWTRDVYKLAVVCVEYPDVKHNDKVTVKDWEQSLFSKDAYKDQSPTGQPVYGSMNDYYLEQSCGKFRVEGKVFGWLEVGKKRAEYASTANRYALLTEALDKLLERDGKDALKGFDGLFFLYAGERFQTQRGGLYWPHRASMSYKGERWAYFICPEGGRNMASISVIAHEFGHLLGMPDLYGQSDNPGSEGLGVWCTMSTGHGRDGKPLHFSAWCKEQLGWVKPAVIDPRVKQKLLLAPVLGTTKECYKVLLQPDGSEYLLLENRLKKGFDRDLPGEGLLIWRVVNDRPILEESHGVLGPRGPQSFLGSVPYPSQANRAFTPLTTPSSKPVKAGGWPVHITNIRKLPDGRIAFHIGYEYL